MRTRLAFSLNGPSWVINPPRLIVSLPVLSFVSQPEKISVRARVTERSWGVALSRVTLALAAVRSTSSPSAGTFPPSQLEASVQLPDRFAFQATDAAWHGGA